MNGIFLFVYENMSESINSEAVSGSRGKLGSDFLLWYRECCGEFIEFYIGGDVLELILLDG